MKTLKDGLLRFAALITGAFTLCCGLLLLAQINTTLQLSHELQQPRGDSLVPVPYNCGLVESLVLAGEKTAVPMLYTLVLGAAACSLTLKAWRSASKL